MRLTHNKTGPLKINLKLLLCFDSIIQRGCNSLTVTILGSSRLSNKKPLGISWPQKPIKVLGVSFSYDEKLSEKANFENKIKSFNFRNLDSNFLDFWQLLSNIFAF